jgi:hypothetical protein
MEKTNLFLNFFPSFLIVNGFGGELRGAGIDGIHLRATEPGHGKCFGFCASNQG